MAFAAVALTVALLVNPGTAVLGMFIIVGALLIVAVVAILKCVRDEVDPESLLPTAVLKAESMQALQVKYQAWMEANRNRHIHSVRWCKPRFDSILRRAVGPLWPNDSIVHIVRIKFTDRSHPLVEW